MIPPTRRRLLTIMGAAAGMALAPSIGRTAAVLPRWRWRGNALGAKAEMTLVHPDEATAKKLIRLAVDEVERLENIFSLYRENSEITRLNLDGHLDTPSPDLVTLLSTARQVSELTDGAFDITVQPLWRVYANHFSKPGADPNGPPAAAIESARRLVDHRALDIASSKIRFGRADMAITLNGIAQGYITDRVAELLHAHGIEQTLIDLGEIRSIGTNPNGRPWRVAIEGRSDHQTIDLIDRAIATSSPANTVFDAARNTHHLFEPKTGRPSAKARTTSVIASSAILADSLSTAFSMMSPNKIAPISDRLPGISIFRAR
ncbi:MAG: FAD:protein FMN transferase [Geminicoccaceae bacterium]